MMQITQIGGIIFQDYNAFIKPHAVPLSIQWAPKYKFRPLRRFAEMRVEMRAVMTPKPTNRKVRPYSGVLFLRIGATCNEVAFRRNDCYNFVKASLEALFSVVLFRRPLRIYHANRQLSTRFTLRGNVAAHAAPA